MTRRPILPAIVLLAGGALAAATAQETSAPFRFETLRAEPDLARRAGAVAQALGVGAWPRSEELYLPPSVGRALLDPRIRVRNETRSCTTVRVADEPWGHCVWSFQSAAGGSEPTGAGREPGASESLDIEITLAPSARGAQELLLSALADNMLDLPTLVELYGAAKRPEGLGDVALLVERPDGTEARLSFSRANVLVRVRGFGAWREQVVPVGRRLDEQLLGQRPLTAEQLHARRLEFGPPKAP